MQQRVLVLGARGFIGKEVVAGLSSSGWATPVLGVRSPSDNSTFEQRTVDATDVQSLSAAMQDVAGVVNCIAGDATTVEANARALLACLQMVSKGPSLIHLSSMAVYGSAVGVVDETAPLLGDLGPYSAAKVAAEKVLAAYPKSVMLRPGCVFGPRSEQWTLRIARLLLARRLGELGAAGDGYCNLVHVGDVVAAIVRALEEPRVLGQAFNLSIPDPPTWNDFLVKFGMALGAVPVRRISGRRLRIETKLLAPPLKIAEILGRAAKIDLQWLPPLLPPSLLRSMRQELRLDSRRAQTELRLTWRSLDAMLREAAHRGGGAELVPT